MSVERPPKQHTRIRQAQALALRLTGNELLMLVALLIVVLGTWGFINLAGKVVTGSTQEFDRWAVQSFRQGVIRHVPADPHMLDQVFLDISALGGPTVLVMMVGAMMIFLAWDRRYNAMLLVVLSTVGGVVLAYLLKEAIGRPRPDVMPRTVVTFSSFPSGHSMLSAIVYPTLGTLLARIVPRKRLKIYFMMVALTLSGLIGVSRVYLGVHYPTDVLAGWAAGLAWAALCWAVAKFLQSRDALEGDDADLCSD